MMDPEMQRMAMEQMKRMSPEQIAEMIRQVQSHPDLMRQAMDG